MNKDTVLELRRLADKMAGTTAVIVFNSTLRDAADEIERLRRNTGCARNQRSTQFCAEALDAQRDVETLKAEVVRNADEFRETLTELRQRVETLTAERDEARRSCCEYAAIVDGADNTEGMESGRFHEVAMRYMKERNWDCFKEDDK
jgi:phage shock protein A